MIVRFIRKQKKSITRWLKKRQPLLAVLALVSIVGIVSYTGYVQNKQLVIDPATYQPLLQLIARAESNGNYNAYFGNAANTTTLFTQMSIAEVMNWQARYIQQGSASSAVGRYQIMDTTLAGLVQKLGIDTNQKFNEPMQDKLAVALLHKRGVEQYVTKEITQDQFAANLAMEWAALPRVTGPNPNDSYYASDGLNKSRVSVGEIKKAIEPIQASKRLLP